MKRNFCDCCRSSRGVTRLDGTRGKRQVWRPYVRTWDLSEANVLYWRKYLWHCWDFMAPSYWFGARGIVLPFPPLLCPWRPGNCAPLSPRYWHCFVSNVERISKISSLSPLETFLQTPMLLTWISSSFWHFSDMFWLFLTCKYNKQKYLNYINFNKPFLCNIQSLET